MLRIFTVIRVKSVKALLQPWKLLLLIPAGWVNRGQQDVITYLISENRVLRQKIGRKRILLDGEIACRERLGELLRYYYRKVA